MYAFWKSLNCLLMTLEMISNDEIKFVYKILHIGIISGLSKYDCFTRKEWKYIWIWIAFAHDILQCVEYDDN